MTERPFLAFRVWKDYGDGKLYSTNYKYPWSGADPGPCRHLASRSSTGAVSAFGQAVRALATGLAYEERPCAAGFPRCHECGYYSYSTWPAAQKSSYPGEKRFMGVVELFGVVRWAKTSVQLQKPALRYRSERARVVALLPGAWDAEFYRVPEINEDEMRFLEMAGYTVPESKDESGMGLC